MADRANNDARLVLVNPINDIEPHNLRIEQAKIENVLHKVEENIERLEAETEQLDKDDHSKLATLRLRRDGLKIKMEFAEAKSNHYEAKRDRKNNPERFNSLEKELHETAVAWEEWRKMNLENQPGPTKGGQQQRLGKK